MILPQTLVTWVSLTISSSLSLFYYLLCLELVFSGVWESIHHLIDDLSRFQRWIYLFGNVVHKARTPLLIVLKVRLLWLSYNVEITRLVFFLVELELLSLAFIQSGFYSELLQDFLFFLLRSLLSSLLHFLQGLWFSISISFCKSPEIVYFCLPEFWYYNFSRFFNIFTSNIILLHRLCVEHPLFVATVPKIMNRKEKTKDLTMYKTNDVLHAVTNAALIVLWPIEPEGDNFCL